MGILVALFIVVNNHVYAIETWNRPEDFETCVSMAKTIDYHLKPTCGFIDKK